MGIPMLTVGIRRYTNAQNRGFAFGLFYSVMNIAAFVSGTTLDRKLQCTGTTLHYTALYYTTLHYTTLHYTTLHYTALHYTTLHYTAQHFTSLQIGRAHV